MASVITAQVHDGALLERHPSNREAYKPLLGKVVRVLGWAYGEPSGPATSQHIAIEYKHGRKVLRFNSFPIIFLQGYGEIAKRLPKPVLQGFRVGGEVRRASHYPGHRFRFPCAFEEMNEAEAVQLARWVLARAASKPKAKRVAK